CLAMASPASSSFATSFSLPGLASMRANRATLYLDMFKLLQEFAGRRQPTQLATTEQYVQTDRSVYYTSKKRERVTRPTLRQPVSMPRHGPLRRHGDCLGSRPLQARLRPERLWQERPSPPLCQPTARPIRAKIR